MTAALRALVALLLLVAVLPLGAQGDDLERGVLLLKQNKTGEAITLLERVVKAEPNNARAHYYLGAAYGDQAMHSGRARQMLLAGRIKGSFERAVALDPDQLDARWGLVHFHLLAPGFMGGNKAVAREQAAEIRKRNPFRGAMAFGAIYAAEKNIPAAEREYQQAMQLAPDSLSPISRLGALYRDVKQYEKAFALFERTLQEEPGMTGVHFLIGRTARESGMRLEQGEESLRRYLRGKPKNHEPPLARAHFELGGILQLQGDRAAARREYEAALRLDPAFRDAKEALRKLGD